MPNGANCSPTWVWTWTASCRRHNKWPLNPRTATDVFATARLLVTLTSKTVPPMSSLPDKCSETRVLVLSSGQRPEMAAEARRLLPLVAKFAASVELVDLDTVGSLELADFDLAIVVGGDGSILRTAHHMGRRQRPVVAVNLGKLGFLADLTPAEFEAQLPAICSRSLRVVEHLMLDCQLIRHGQAICHEIGLNEAAIFAGARPSACCTSISSSTEY